MKKFLMAAAVIAAFYYLYNQSGSNIGVYADNGMPRTIFFTTEQCGNACDEMRRYLKSRVEFEEHDAFDSGSGHELYEKYGGTGFLPYIVMGEQRVTGPDRGGVISSVAAEFGLEKVKKKERKALQRNFDASGDARVVMYATDWCGYCKEARKYFAANGIDYVEFDIEKDRSAKRDFDALLGSGTPLLYHGYARMVGFNKRQADSQLNL
jgi:glutaredoxin